MSKDDHGVIQGGSKPHVVRFSSYLSTVTPALQETLIELSRYLK